MYQGNLLQCIALSHPNHPLCTMRVPLSARDAAVKNLETSWENVKTFQEKLSTSSLDHLATVNASISSFLAKYSS